MARYRPVFVDLWSCDDKFQDYSAYGKLLYIYLITNTHVNECGLYRITYKTISNETEIPRAEVSRLIKEELLNNVSYDDENNVIFVHKFLKYNGSGNPNLIQKSIDRDRRLIKTTLWKGFDKYYTRDLEPIKNGSEILPSIPIPKGKGKVNKELCPNTKYSDVDIELSSLLIEGILKNNPRSKAGKLTEKQKESWYNQCRLLRESGWSPDEIRTVIQFCLQDDFEMANVLSMGKLRERFDNLALKARREIAKKTGERDVGRQGMVP